MSGAMRGSQETKTVPKGTRLRACSLLYSIMALIKLLIFLKTHSRAKVASDKGHNVGVIGGEGLPPDRRQGRRHTPICGETPQRPLCSIKLNRRRHRTFLDEAHGGIRAVRFRSQPAAGSRLPIESESSAGSAVTG